MANVMALTLLFEYIFAILFSFVFQGIEKGDYLNDDNINFRNFGNSFAVMFRMSTGENWN